MKVVIQKSPVQIPVPDDKIIKEHFGRVSTGNTNFSFAHMVAPPGWGEPFQTPEFDEVTFIISGKKRIETDNEVIDLEKGESVLIKSGTRVRYSNPFEESCEYVSVCIPAFDINTVHREE